MAKVLRVLVIIILILSAVSLFFAVKLFEKRELLTKRNSVLEETFIKVAKTIEGQDPTEADAPSVMKDISEVSDRELTNPERQAMLEAYPIKLEQQNLPTLDFGNTEKRLQLRNFFAVDSEGDYVLDPVDNKPATRGPGTMQELMDQLFERAKAQQASLNKTRAELTKMRDQFTASIEEINKLKTDGRAAKVELKGEKEKATTFAAEKAELETRVTRLNAEKRELSAELADAKNTIETLNEDKVNLTEDLAKMREQYEELKKKWAGKSSTPGAVVRDHSMAGSAPSAGDKGKIIEANDELKFAIIELSDDAITELLGPERENALPQLEMNVRRTGRQSAVGEFVTRIKLRQAVRGKNFVVADILNDWQQAPVEKGDVVFF
jgi:acetyl/propionyl-CoA carboxylase alpha subunit